MPRVETIISDIQRGLLFKDGKFQKLLEPGRHEYSTWITEFSIEVYDVVRTLVPEKVVDIIEATQSKVDKKLIETVQTEDYEIAIIYYDGHPSCIVAPLTKASFWKVVTKVEVKRLNILEQKTLPKQILKIDKIYSNRRTDITKETVIEPNEIGLFFVDGEFVEPLKQGRHAFWSYDRKIDIKRYDLRPTAHEITAQEILTKDRVSLRVTLTAFMQTTDPEKVFQATDDYVTYVYRLVQFAIREAIANRTLDEVLNNRETVDGQIRGYVDEHIGDIGVRVTELGVKDIILPGEMRELINKVVEAEKTAQANLIRRREETAATRSLLNTARLMEDNPVLMRLKELEALEKLTEKVGKIELITGRDVSGFDGLLNNILKLQNKSDSVA